jgi:hypothetical protein
MSPAGLHDGYAIPAWPARWRLVPAPCCDCNPPTCLRTQLTGTICHTWPAADIDRGFVG